MKERERKKWIHEGPLVQLCIVQLAIEGNIYIYLFQNTSDQAQYVSSYGELEFDDGDEPTEQPSDKPTSMYEAQAVEAE